MQAGSSNGPLQNRYLSGTGNAGGIHLPVFNNQILSANAVVLMIMMEDLSCLIKGFTHWIIWNIPAADKIIKAIPAGKLISSLQGTIQGIGYGFHCYTGLKPF